MKKSNNIKDISTKLNVPLIRQPKGSLDCGIAGLTMILNYHKVKDSFKYLKTKIDVHACGTYAPQIGQYLLQKGFDVEIVTMHPKLFTLNNEGINTKEIKNILKEKEKTVTTDTDKKVVKYFMDFLKYGGKINVKIPSLEDIKTEIDNKRPLGALMTTNFIKGNKPIFNFHFNVITGYDSKNIYVNDPIDKSDIRGGKHSYEKDAFFYGLYASAYGDMDNASLIKVRKRGKNQ